MQTYSSNKWHIVVVKQASDNIRSFHINSEHYNHNIVVLTLTKEGRLTYFF